MKLTKALIALLIKAAASTVEAAQHNQFECGYISPLGNKETVHFEGPRGVDLTQFELSGQTVPFKVNGSNETRDFKVTLQSSRNGYQLFYSSRNPIWVSDIGLVIQVNNNNEVTEFKGTWTVDHPPVLKMSCQFLN